MFQNNTVRVTLGLIVGLAAIMYFNPPHTPCQSQREIYLEAIKPYQKPFVKNSNLCREHGDSGGCLGLFDTVNKLESKLSDVSLTCQKELIDDKQTRLWMTNAMELFVRLAWGTKPPASYLYRNGWLEMSHLDTYCKLKKHLEDIYGDNTWTSLVNYLLSDLPGAQELGRDESWNRSILSDPCKYGF